MINVRIKNTALTFAFDSASMNGNAARRRQCLSIGVNFIGASKGIVVVMVFVNVARANWYSVLIRFRVDLS